MTHGQKSRCRIFTLASHTRTERNGTRMCHATRTLARSLAMVVALLLEWKCSLFLRLGLARYSLGWRCPFGRIFAQLAMGSGGDVGSFPINQSTVSRRYSGSRSSLTAFFPSSPGCQSAKNSRHDAAVAAFFSRLLTFACLLTGKHSHVQTHTPGWLAGFAFGRHQQQLHLYNNTKQSHFSSGDFSFILFRGKLRQT